ncbi:MAG TPA: hypothetical protein VHM19_20100 [Polyangiales bacterium]|nr:hypothetical protein [Polyangiales bacterium]
MTTKTHHQSSGSNPPSQARQQSGGANGGTGGSASKLAQGLERGKDTLAELKEDMTDKMSTQLEAAKDTMREVSSDAGRALQSAGNALMTVAKENPLPLALTGVGITWLAVNLLTASSDETSQATSSKGSNKSSRKGNGISASSIQQMAKDNPLLAGAALFATGAANGMALPRTNLENTWLGQGRDQMITKVKKAARETMNKVETVAGAITSGSEGSSSNRGNASTTH